MATTSRRVCSPLHVVKQVHLYCLTNVVEPLLRVVQLRQRGWVWILQCSTVGTHVTVSRRRFVEDNSESQSK